MAWVAVVFVILIAVFALPYVGGRRARWFRRIWASHRVGGEHGTAWRLDATQKLLDVYGIDFSDEIESVRSKLGELFADATRFDVTNRNNRGVQVMPLLAKSVQSLKGDWRHPELNDDLQQMVRTDGIAHYEVMTKTFGQH